MVSRASDKCQREKRKTINGDDLLWAMATLGFEEYIEPLKLYLTRYREVCSAFLSPYSDSLYSLTLTLCFLLVYYYMDLDNYTDGGQCFLSSVFLLY